MKQPELGQKILQWRKAKGLTQEELVEMCQINVRTIQRIEAGEVTPRSFTLKTIMEALGVDASEFKEEHSEGSTVEGSALKPNKLFQFSFYFGIIYLITAFAEAFVDITIWEAPIEPPGKSGFGYLVLKLIIVFTYIPFKYGFYKLGKDAGNHLISVASILLIAGILLAIGKDLYMFFYIGEFHIEWKMAEAIYFGMVYILFGIGLLRFQKVFGTVALVSGCLGILTGVAFISIIFAIPGMVVLTVFEILLLVILYSTSHKLGSTTNKKTPFSLIE
ncbi:helix-turn-helix domain-containing protein [Anditalea andensis]|nr:helix-turn-helix transcriptional regulator [Anditalea andensis]